MWKRVCLFKEEKEFIWSDNWYFDNGDIWFVAGDMDILFCIKKGKKEAVYISRVPSKNVHEFRNHPKCIKKDNTIFCFPDEGKFIECYNLQESVWKSVHIDNPKKVRLSCLNIYDVNYKIYLVSIGLRKVIEFDIETKKIDKYYDLRTKEISGSILVDKNIYIIDSFSSNILKLNCLDKTITRYFLPEINDNIKTICFDGQKFWMSGKKKKLYIWEEDINKISVIDTFPDDFGGDNHYGKYDNLNEQGKKNEYPLFLYSFVAEDFIWFIPFRANEILYINKNTNEMRCFYLKSEEQTCEEIKAQLLGHKYLLEYVKENRFIGIYSLKNKWIFEIDAKKLTYSILDYKLDETSISKILSDFLKKESLSFEKEFDLNYFIKCISLIDYKKCRKVSNIKSIGTKILNL